MQEFSLKDTEKFSHLKVREVVAKIEAGEIGTEVSEPMEKAIELGLRIHTNIDTK